MKIVDYVAVLICMLAFLMIIAIDKIKTRRIITSLLNRQEYLLLFVENLLLLKMS